MGFVEEKPTACDAAGIELGDSMGVLLHEMRSGREGWGYAQLRIPPETVFWIFRVYPEHALRFLAIHF